MRWATLGFLCLAACSSAGATPLTVCQLASARPAPDAMVHVHATAWVALRHGGSLLQDTHCPHDTLGFRFADDARDRPRVKKLSDAMTGDVMDLKPRVFDVRLVGQLSAPTASDPKGLFVVSDVEDFKQHP